MRGKRWDCMSFLCVRFGMDRRPLHATAMCIGASTANSDLAPRAEQFAASFVAGWESGKGRMG